jgi:flagellar motor protein MotB
VISFAPKKAAAAAAPATGVSTPASSASTTPSEPAQDHGALLRQAAMDRIKAEDSTKKAAADTKTKDETEAKAKQEAEAKAKQEAEEKAKQEAEAKAKKEAEEKIKKAKEAVAPKASFSALLKQPAPVPVAKAAPTYSTSGRIIFVKADLLRYVSLEVSCVEQLLDVWLLVFFLFC